MSFFRTTLFIGYCLLAVVILGTAFSRIWRTSRLLLREQIPVLTTKTVTSHDTASIKPIETTFSQS